MTEHDAEPAPRGADGDPPEPDISPYYQAYLERNEARPDSCTIYTSLSAETARGQWIKAWADAFVSRDDAR